MRCKGEVAVWPLNIRQTRLVYLLNLTLSPSLLHMAEGHTNEGTAGYQSSPSVSYRACGAPTRQERHLSFISPARDGAEPEVSVLQDCRTPCCLHCTYESQSSLHSLCFPSGRWRSSSSSRRSPQQPSVTPQVFPQLTHM